MSKRTDIHRPSAEEFNPADYECVDCFDLRPEAFDLFSGPARMLCVNRMLEEGYKFSGVNGMGKCDHCGMNIRYAALMTHAPTHTMIWIGEQCLGNRFELTKSEFQNLRKNAALNRDRMRKSEKVAKILSEMSEQVKAAYAWGISWTVARGINPDAWGEGIAGEKAWEDCTPVEHVARRDKGWGIANDIACKVEQYASPLSEKQSAFLVKLHGEYAVRQLRRIEELKKVETGELKSVPVGRVTVIGEVVSTKVVHSDFGSTLKMTVRSDDGFKVFGSVPSTLQYPAVDVELKGNRIEFTATLEPSQGDPLFGFYSRPSKAKLLEAAA